MKPYKLHTLYYFISWLLLVGMVSCQCKPTPPTSPIQEDKAEEKTLQEGIWHTGTFDKKITPAIPDGTTIPHFYNHTFQIYRVQHDGSCGYRSFIPILLADILVRDKWKVWLENMRTTFYEPAKAILQPLDLTGTKYIQFRPTDNPDQLLIDIKNLLQKLSQEPAPRPLQEPEIQLLVAFLRQTVLMNEILIAKKSLELKKKRSPTTVTLTQEIDNFFARGHFNTKNFWSFDTSFIIFYLPFYTTLFQNDQTSCYHIHCYIYPKGKSIPIGDMETMKAIKRDPLTVYPGRPAPIPHAFPSQVPTVWLYHHDNAYFEYLVCEEAN
jgi:hypothetical protein